MPNQNPKYPFLSASDINRIGSTGDVAWLRKTYPFLSDDEVADIMATHGQQGPTQTKTFDRFGNEVINGVANPTPTSPPVEYITNPDGTVTQTTGGGGSDTGTGDGGGADTGGGGSFNIPSDVFPFSFSGIDWDNTLASNAMDYLNNMMAGISKVPENISNLGKGYYKNMMTRALGPQGFQGTLNNLGRKNMLNSSVASDAMASTATNIMRDVGDKGYLSQLQGETAKLGIPGIFGNIANLAKTSGSSDPLAPYKLGVDFLSNM